MSVLEVAPHGAELLDDPCAAAPSVRESLRNIARANRWLGGAAALRYALRRTLPARATHPLLLVDIGTGAGDLPRMASRWAARRGIPLRAVGLEVSGVAARLARQHGVACVVGDGGVLPLRDRSVDYVLLSQIAHHFSADAIVRLFRECARVARRALIVCDLRRSRVATRCFPLAGWALRFDRHTIRDGVTSLERGFTSESLTRLLAAAGLQAQVVRRPGSRLVAIASTPDSRLSTPESRLPTPDSRLPTMHTIDSLYIAAPPDIVFGYASDVERWPDILPHYRWVRHTERRSDGSLVVEMAAWRPFGLFRWPTWWMSEMWIEPARREVRYRHVRGITTGMAVLWSVTPEGEGTRATIVHEWDGPRWPLIRRPAAEWVIGPVFVHGIASRTLAGIGRAAERGRVHA